MSEKLKNNTPKSEQIQGEEREKGIGKNKNSELKERQNFYLKLGFPPLALRTKEKRPYWKGWEKLTIEESQEKE